MRWSHQSVRLIMCHGVAGYGDVPGGGERAERDRRAGAPLLR